jgi:beta-lactamase regulating signal transducer with metallopeptidase domain
VDTLLSAALGNAAFVAVLTPIIGVLGRMSRRPALVHSLWLLVFLKLLTPPLWPVSFSWLVGSHMDQISSGSIAHEPEFSVTPVEEFSQREAAAEAIDNALLQRYGPAAPADLSVAPTPPTRELEPIVKAPPEAPTPSTAPARSPVSLQSSLVAIWLSGSGLWLALAAYRLYRFHRLLRFTQPASATLQARTRRLADRLGLKQCPEVRVVAAPVSPLLWALVRKPWLVVPRYLLERLTEEQWDTLLAHELAHLRRHDHWVRILEMAALGLYWWYPLVWWARGELHEAEEQCCDAWVVWALPGAADVYATALVEAVTYLSNARSALPLAASGIGQMHLLKRRVTMIMRGTTPRALSAAGFLAVLGLGAFLLPLYPTWAQTNQPPEPAPDNASPGATATTSQRFVPATTSVEIASSDHPSSGTPATVGEGGDAEPRNAFGGGIAERRGYPETVEDAKDEIDLLRVQLEQRRAELREAEARLHQNKIAAERISKLAKTGAVDSSEIEKTQIEMQVQEARYAVKQAQIKEVELRIKQAQRRLGRFAHAAQPEARTVAPEKAAYPSSERPTGSAIPQSSSQRYMSSPVYGGGRGGAASGSGGTSAGGQMPPGGYPPSAATGAASGSFSGGSFGPSGSFPGSGFGRGSGFGGGVSAPGNASTYEHRLAEVEKKLQALMDEMKSLRKKQRPEQPEAKP